MIDFQKKIKNSDKSLHLMDEALQQTKLIFGRHCFCRGQTGYFKLEKGSLILEEKNNTFDLKINFSTEKVPQIINQITAKIN